MRFYLVYRVGLVDKIFGLVDLVNKALGLVNKPKWHFEMACILPESGFSPSLCETLDRPTCAPAQALFCTRDDC